MGEWVIDLRVFLCERGGEQTNPTPEAYPRPQEL